jgi:hypothetical protein
MILNNLIYGTQLQRTDGIFTENPDKKYAKQNYDLCEFTEAYKKIGYMLHLIEDSFVPAHQRLCIQGYKSVSFFVNFISPG